MISTTQAPAAIGPYSQAIVHDGIVYCSGQLALDPATLAMRGDSITEQTAQVFANLRAVLAEAGSSLADVIKTTVFLKDMADFAAMNAVYTDAFGNHKPARSTVEVARLPKDARIEIECVAVAHST
ncbi:MAG: RidA family protein [Verrucomicrobia bacterium]|nr:RidA family protein [Verrucomicrobiota bacterium]